MDFIEMNCAWIFAMFALETQDLAVTERIRPLDWYRLGNGCALECGGMEN